MKHTILIILLALTCAASSFAFEPDHYSNPKQRQLLVMLSAKEIDKELRFHHLNHLAENSDLADYIEYHVIDLTELRGMVKKKLDAYSQKFPDKKLQKFPTGAPVTVEWLTDVVRGVAK